MSFAFPTNITMSAGEFVLVVSFDPTNTAKLNAFKTKYGITNAPRFFGPYSGKLDNSDDFIELYKPDPVQLPPHPDAGFVPQVLVEKVSYRDSAPWPTNADGGGLSLQRITATNYGNEPTNWLAAVPRAGQSSSPSSPPVIANTFQNLSVPAGTNLTLTILATGSAPLSYQWFFNNGAMATATGTNLLLTFAQPTNSGLYSALVTNSAGSSYSNIANLTVIAPPPPSLLSALAPGNQVRVSWPTGVVYYTLYSSSNVGPGAVWIAVGTAPAISNGNFQLNISPTNARQFFRLSQP